MKCKIIAETWRNKGERNYWKSEKEEKEKEAKRNWWHSQTNWAKDNHPGATSIWGTWLCILVFNLVVEMVCTGKLFCLNVVVVCGPELNCHGIPSHEKSTVLIQSDVLATPDSMCINSLLFLYWGDSWGWTVNASLPTKVLSCEQINPLSNRVCIFICHSLVIYTILSIHFVETMTKLCTFGQ